MIDHQFPQTQTAKLRTHIHPLDFAILGPKQLDASTPSRCAVLANEKEMHLLFDQLFHAIAVTALPRVERFKVRFEFTDQSYGIGAVRRFCCYRDGHRVIDWN